MRKKTFGIVVLALSLAACGSGDDKGNTFVAMPIDLNGDGINDGVTVDGNGDGKADGVDTNNDGVVDKPLPGGSNGGTATGGSTGSTGTGSTGGGGGGTTGTGGGTGGANSGGIGIFPQDGGDDTPDPRDATVVNPNPATVVCGSGDCTVKDNFACCDQISGTSWTGMCLGESACSNSGLEFTKAVSRCDTKDDCGGLADQYCCFVHGGPPPTPFGAGAPNGRRCLTIADCNNRTGVPPGTGKFSCQKDSDCPNGLKCNPEPAGESVGGGSRPGRPWVKICG